MPDPRETLSLGDVLALVITHDYINPEAFSDTCKALRLTSKTIRDVVDDAVLANAKCSGKQLRLLLDSEQLLPRLRKLRVTREFTVDDAKALVAKEPPRLQGLHITAASAGASIIATEGNFAGLTSLWLGSVPNTGPGFQSLHRLSCDHLKLLHLGGKYHATNATDILTIVQRFRELRDLSLEAMKLTRGLGEDSTLFAEAASPDLERLVFHHIRGMRCLGRVLKGSWPKLTTLQMVLEDDVCVGRQVKQEKLLQDLADAAWLTHLQTLTLEHSKNYTLSADQLKQSAALAALGRNLARGCLKELHVWNLRVDKEWFAHMNIPSLRELRVAVSPDYLPLLDANLFTALGAATLPALQRLYVSVEELEHVADRLRGGPHHVVISRMASPAQAMNSWPEIESVQFSNVKFDAISLSCLSNIVVPKLTSFGLRRAEFSSYQQYHAFFQPSNAITGPKWPKLRELDLAGTMDAFLVGLVDAAALGCALGLTSLIIGERDSGRKIDKVQLKVFTDRARLRGDVWPNLKYIYVGGTRKRNLEKAFPNAKIE